MASHQDTSLLLNIEEVFNHTENVVISAIQVVKRMHDASSTGAKLLKSLAGESQQDSLVPRVFAFTVKRTNTERFSASLHVCKVVDSAGASRYECGKSWKLNLAKRIKLVPRQYQHGERVFVILTIAAHHQYGEYTAAYGFANQDELMLFLSITAHLARHMDEEPPELVGLDSDDVGKWWGANSSAMVPLFSAFAAKLLAPGQQVRSSAEAASVLVSAKEEKDLEELLDMFAMGVGDTDTFQECLQDEFHALEAANVHAVLESGALVEGVMYRMRRAQGLLDDLDESLKVFDFKLRHMRDDIAAIEASNNALELQARNNGKLLAALQGLLADVKVESGVQRLIDNPHFEPDRIHLTLEAGWALHNKLQRMNPDCPNHLPSGILSMRVCREAHGTLINMATRFVARACTYLNDVFNELSQQTLQQLGKVAGSSRVAAPKRAGLRAQVAGYVDLVRLLQALDPPSLTRLQSSYCATLNTIIRKEMRNCTNELRKAAAADMASNNVDYNMHKVEKAPRKTGGVLGAKGSDTMTDHTPESAGGSVEDIPAALERSLAALKDLKNGYFEGSGSMPLHEGYRTLLATFIPTLLDEAEFAADFLLFYSTPDDGAEAKWSKRDTWEDGEEDSPRVLQQSGVVAVENLMAGIEEDFKLLVDMTARNQQVLAIPMLAVTDKWLSRVEGRQIAARIYRALTSCRQTLTTNFESFASQLQHSVEKFDTRPTISSKLQQGVKHLHVLPFISQFALLAHHCEILLNSISEEDETPPSPPARAPGISGPDDLPDEPLASGPHVPVRKLLDSTYDRLTTTMFTTLEKVAVADVKRGDRLRLENYGYFAESVGPLVSHARSLDHSRRQAEKGQSEAMATYVQQQLDYGKMWKLVELEGRVAGLLKVVTPSEVPFQVGCTVSEVKSLLSTALHQPEKKMQSMYARVRKHLGATQLSMKVWEELQRTLLAKYFRLEELMSKCYPNLPLRPSPEELKELFRAIA